MTRIAGALAVLACLMTAGLASAHPATYPHAHGAIDYVPWIVAGLLSIAVLVEGAARARRRTDAA